MRRITPDDLRFMDTGLALAFAALGSTAPNPSVGCIVVREGRVVGAAATAAGGRPHAEPQALEIAGPASVGASVYVTLEPCAHYGRTPPCAEALIAARPAEVIVACTDPFAEVAGRGIAMLREAGVPVVEGVRRAAAEALNAGFFHRLKTGRPLTFDDQRAGLFDADVTVAEGDDVDSALERAGAAGLTRVRLKTVR